jgi:hypothetical protein
LGSVALHILEEGVLRRGMDLLSLEVFPEGGLAVCVFY